MKSMLLPITLLNTVFVERGPFGKVILVAHTVRHIFPLPSLAIRGQYSLALIVFLACSFLNRHYRAP